MNKVAIYARSATKSPDAVRSLKKQISRLCKQAKTNGDVVVGEYVDRGVSGLTLQRHALNRLLRDLRSRKIASVYTKNIDRIGRDPLIIQRIINKIRKTGSCLIVDGKNLADSLELTIMYHPQLKKSRTP